MGDLTRLGCECGGCSWNDDENEDTAEYVVVRFGRCWVPWESEIEHCSGLEFAVHRRNMLRLATPSARFAIYRLTMVAEPA